MYNKVHIKYNTKMIFKMKFTIFKRFFKMRNILDFKHFKTYNLTT